MTPTAPTLVSIRNEVVCSNTLSDLAAALRKWQTNQPVDLFDRSFEQMKLIRALQDTNVLNNLHPLGDDRREFQENLKFYLSLVMELPLDPVELDDNVTKVDVFLDQLVQDCESHQHSFLSYRL